MALQEPVPEDDQWTLRDSPFLSLARDQGDTNFCELYAHIACMETKIRMMEEEDNIHLPLSLSHVLDHLEEGANGFRPRFQARTNDQIIHFLETHGVASQENYGPDTKWDGEKFEKFELETGFNRVRIAGQTTLVNRRNRKPEPNFRTMLRTAIRYQGPIIASIKMRDELYHLEAGQMLDPLPPPVGRRKIKLHTVLLTGYGILEDGRHYFEFLNSWGPDWADDGYGLICSEDIVEAWHYGIELIPQ